jgi:hypothetical protein
VGVFAPSQLDTHWLARLSGVLSLYCPASQFDLSRPSADRTSETRCQHTAAQSVLPTHSLHSATEPSKGVLDDERACQFRVATRIVGLMGDSPPARGRGCRKALGMPAPPNRGGLADDSAETTAKVRLIRKTAFHGDLAQRVAELGHQVLSARNSHPSDVFRRRTAETRLECSTEFASTERCQFRQIAQFDLCAEVNGHIALNAARLPELQLSAL